MIDNDKEYESHIRFYINYRKIIWMDVICFLVLLLYGMLFFFIGKEFVVYMIVFIMSYFIFVLYIIQKSVRIFMFYRWGKIEIDFVQNVLVYRDYARKTRIEFSLDRVVLQCSFLDLSGCFDKGYDIEQREIRLSERGLDDRFEHYMWDCTEYVYYLNDYMIDLNDMGNVDKELFLNYMKKNGKYREI